MGAYVQPFGPLVNNVSPTIIHGIGGGWFYNFDYAIKGGCMNGAAIAAAATTTAVSQGTIVIAADARVDNTASAPLSANDLLKAAQCVCALTKTPQLLASFTARFNFWQEKYTINACFQLAYAAAVMEIGFKAGTTTKFLKMTKKIGGSTSSWALGSLLYEQDLAEQNAILQMVPTACPTCPDATACPTTAACPTATPCTTSAACPTCATCPDTGTTPQSGSGRRLAENSMFVVAAAAATALVVAAAQA